MAKLHLILGGARSGKSRYAEQLACAADAPVTYIATAQNTDAEMAARIAQHQADRPAHWQVRETPLALAAVIRAAVPGEVLLVDCLTLWLNNLHYHAQDAALACDELFAALHDSQNTVLLVSNEITMGVVPMGPESRRYVDDLGRLHQRLAQIAEQVTLLVAGIPLSIKEPA
jgi:adenosylcobinamide kinase / adenosylcobinamide-phosphate guanylyltransferase